MSHQDKKTHCFLTRNKDIYLEALRIYLGISLMFKGYFFLIHRDQILDVLALIPFNSFISAHVLVFVHIIGGFFLTIGLLTRMAALIQVPFVVGAIIFVHWPDGSFSLNQNLEYLMLMLFLLLIFTVYGGGRVSVDNLLRKRFSRQQK